MKTDMEEFLLISGCLFIIGFMLFDVTRFIIGG